MNDRIVVVVTDASVIGHVMGPGAWACEVDHIEYYGPLPMLMGNNIAELWAIYEGLSRCPYGARVLVWCDNRMALQWATNKAPVSLYNPLKELVILIQLSIRAVIEALDLDVMYQRVKGHKTNENHNRIDALARSEARRVADEYFSQ